MSRRAVLLTGTLLLAGGGLLAQVTPDERIPIRDRDRLDALGFPRDATNLFVWSRADLGRSPARQATAVSEEPDWGTSTGYTTVSASELREHLFYTKLVRDPGAYTYCWENDDYLPTLAHAQFVVPDGATLEFLRYWAYDASSDFDLIFRVYETCQGSAGGSQPVTTLIQEAFTFGSAGDFNFSASLNDYPVENKDCVYFIEVEFAPQDVSCQRYDLKVRKFSVSWTRQVSPAPATATFGDVPTNHPFFQFVEALAKSGTTGGCGAGNYCPDAPLTRGQMAVFLAKALGLQWP